MFTGQLGTLSSRPANIIPGYLGVMTAIAIAPASTNVGLGGAVQLSAAATDQLGYALEVQAAIAWTVPSGNGTIGGSGLFTAPASKETDTVRATSGSVHADSTITVVSLAATRNRARSFTLRNRGRLG